MTSKEDSNALVDIACEFRQDREKSIVVWAGEMEDVTDERTGEIREREKWVFLPKSLAQYDNDAKTVTMPEWMAVEKGLI